MGGVYELFEVVGFLLSPLLVLVFVLAIVAVAQNGNRAQQGGPRPAPRKIPSQTDRISQMVREVEERMDMLDVRHEREDCTFSYSTQDPTFSFNGRQVVDELAELRRKNEAHERHLLERVHRD